MNNQNCRGWRAGGGGCHLASLGAVRHEVNINEND